MVFKKLVSGIASLALALSVFAGLSVTANAEAAADGTYTWDFVKLYESIGNNTTQMGCLDASSATKAAYYTAGGTTVTSAETDNKTDYYPSSVDTVRIKSSSNSATSYGKLTEKGLYAGGKYSNIAVDVYVTSDIHTFYMVVDSGDTGRGGKRTGVADDPSAEKVCSINGTYDLVKVTFTLSNDVESGVGYVGCKNDNGHIYRIIAVPDNVTFDPMTYVKTYDSTTDTSITDGSSADVYTKTLTTSGSQKISVNVNGEVKTQQVTLTDTELTVAAIIEYSGTNKGYFPLVNIVE